MAATGVTKCKEPKWSIHRGRCWSGCDVILEDGTRVDGWYERTWGSFFYFRRPHTGGEPGAMDAQMYKARIDDYDTDQDGVSITPDLRQRRKD